MRYLVLIFLISLQYSCKDKEDNILIEGKWEKCYESFFPGAKDRYNPVYFAEGDTLFYGLGDYPLLESSVNHDLWMYTKAGWSKIADFPGILRIDPLLIVDRKDIYVGLGTNEIVSRAGLKDIWKYNMTQQVWDSLDFEFPGGTRNGAVSFLADGKIYFGLGKEANVCLTDMYTFDPINGWQIFYTDRQVYPTIFELDGEIYSCFGVNQDGYIRTISKFNPKNLQWTSVGVFDETDYPDITRMGAKAFVIEEKGEKFVYIIGGKPEHNTTDFWNCCRYNPRLQRLEKIDCPFSADQVKAAFTINNVGYVFDGEYVWKFILE